MSLPQTPKTFSINIRAQARQKNLIDQAAEKTGKSRSEFMLDAACQAAQDTLLDQAFFIVDHETFTKFESLMEKPLPPTDKLRRFMNTKAPWDK